MTIKCSRLVLVFAHMYELFEPNRQRWDAFLLVLFVGAVLLWLGIEVEKRRAMSTPVLQMLVFLAAAFGFAGYVLKMDKSENPPKTVADQRTIDFPPADSAQAEDRRSAVMSHV